MPEIGYHLSSEEHSPNELVQCAHRAEEIGFSFAMISDHYHPWIDQQGQSPFVWSVIGAIAATTQTLRLGTAVTCPTFRIAPPIIAQAAATAAAMMPGRFFLGLGTGENLNEHILGEHWPPVSVRQDRLAEAVEIIRLLWEGEEASYWGDFFTVENARIYTLPDPLPEIFMAAAGPGSANLAAEIADGLISTTPNPKVIKEFEESGGKGKPRYGKVTVCWARTEEEALDTAFRVWPTQYLPGALHTELSTPADFESAVKLVKKDDFKEMILGPDPQRYIKEIEKMSGAGYDHVFIHQIGPDQEGFMNFFQKEVMAGLS